MPKMPKPMKYDKIPEMCGTCIYRKWVHEFLDYVCMNPDPELHGIVVDFNDYCGEWGDQNETRRSN